jgi:hypothetical protein
VGAGTAGSSPSRKFAISQIDLNYAVPRIETLLFIAAVVVVLGTMHRSGNLF